MLTKPFDKLMNCRTYTIKDPTVSWQAFFKAVGDHGARKAETAIHHGDGHTERRKNGKIWT